MKKRLLALAVLVACRGSGDDESGGVGSATDPTQPVDGGSRIGPQGAPDGGDGAKASDDDGGVVQPVPYVHFDVNHVLSTGQSNSVANDGKPILSSTQPFSNLMFDTGIMTAADCDRDGCTGYQKPSSLVPLVEGDTFWYPVETMSAGLANEVTKLATQRYGKPAHDVLVSLHGRSGNNYWCLRKGGCDWWADRGYVKPFDEAMMQVADAKALATAAGKTYAVRAVTAIHGEHDHYAESGGYSYFPLPRTDGTGLLKDYGEALEEWQRDYESSVKAVTGQTVPVPLLISQYSHWNDVPTTKIAYQQLAAHERSKGKVVIVGPTYRLPYTSACLHFTADGERWLGEYFAKAYARIVVEGLPWEPLRPVSARLAGSVITVRYLVPVPPLVLDTERVRDPGSYGFEYFDASGAPPAISNVAIVGPDTVKITLAAAPTGANKRIRYAYTFTGCGGSGTIARGNLRDSDATPSQAGYDLYNWSVHFDMPL